MLTAPSYLSIIMELRVFIGALLIIYSYVLYFNKRKVLIQTERVFENEQISKYSDRAGAQAMYTSPSFGSQYTM